MMEILELIEPYIQILSPMTICVLNFILYFIYSHYKNEIYHNSIYLKTTTSQIVEKFSFKKELL